MEADVLLLRLKRLGSDCHFLEERRERDQVGHNQDAVGEEKGTRSRYSEEKACHGMEMRSCEVVLVLGHSR
jgi:hypothetical protein